MRSLWKIDTTSKNQYLATFSVNLLSIAYGTSTGWSSSSFLLLESEENSPLPNGHLSTDELSWISSLICFGGIMGTIINGFLVNYISKKILLMALALPQILSWVLIIFAENAYYLYISRFLCGFMSGGIFVIIPLFVSEISSDNVRGTLGSLIMVCGNIGILIAFVIGHYIDFFGVAYFNLLFPIIFIITFLFFPDTPYHYMKLDKQKEAEASLMFYRNIKPNPHRIETQFICELNMVKKSVESNKESEPNSHKITWNDLSSRAAIKSILIGIALILVHELCGVFVMLNYTATIFAESGSDISPNLSAIIVGFIQLVGTLAATQLIDRAGRKFLFVLSSIGCGISLTILGSYTYLNALGYPMHEHSWLAIASFSSMLFLASCGIIPLPYVIMAETMPEKIRSIGTTICMCISWTLSFTILKCFSFLMDEIGMHGCLFSFAVCCFCGSVFILIFMPETKGKSYNDIRMMLDNRSKN